MSVYGIGCDIVKIARIEKALKNKNFLKKIFTLSEIKIIKKKIIKFQVMQRDLRLKKLFQKLWELE